MSKIRSVACAPFSLPPQPTFHYGGQAILDGVMMRGQRHFAISLRLPDGKVDTTTQPLSTLYTGKLRKTPLARGFIVLLESLLLGTRAVLYSASASEGEGEKASPALVWGMVFLALGIAVALFFILPLFLARLLDPYISSSLVSNLVEGAIRLGIFLAYLKGVSLVPEVRRVFAYHGAEHRVVNAYEDGAALEAEAVRKYSIAHVRCGTSFILAVLVIAILVFALLGRPPLWLSLLSRLLLLPLIAALGYEVAQLGARHFHNTLMRVLVLPGLALQALTTREPEDSQVEVALSALKGVIEADQGTAASTSPSGLP